MSGAGHMADMTARMKQNRAQLPSKRNKQKYNKLHSAHAYSNKNPYRADPKAVSGEELKQIKQQIVESARKEQKQMRIVYGALFVCGIILLIGFLLWIKS